MATFIYKQFVNKFGFQKFSFERFNKFVLSVKRHANTPRVNKFARMLGLLEEGHNYSISDTKQYLNALEYFISNTTVGAHVQNPDFSERHYVAWIRASEYLRIFGEGRMRNEEIGDFRRECEKLRIKDASGRNTHGIVDIDLILDKIIIRYKMLLNKGKDGWLTAFKAADLDDDKSIRFAEFIALYKNIEGDKNYDERMDEMFTA